MTTLLEYIQDLETKHDIRIKFCFEITDDMMDRIERHLQKYDAEKISKPTKTILQTRPMDFPQLDSAEIYIIDFTSTLPVSNEMLRQELIRILNVPEGYVVVRNKADVPEIEQESEIFQEKDKDYQVKVGAEYTKEEQPELKAKDLFGDKYNSAFLKQLKKLSDERKKELKQPKIIKDPDVPADGPEIGDSSRTNKKSPYPQFKG
jgi:hypothetical protein